MVTVGYTKIRDLTSAELSLVPNDEREREFGSSKRRQQFLCGRSLLRLMLQNRSGKPAAGHRLIAAKGGKPECVGGPAVSITHAGDSVACCIADAGEVGIDLEVIGERRDPIKIAAKFFSKEEADWLGTQPQDRFFMLWVLKEAYLKALGRSIFGGLNQFCCRVRPPVIETIRMSEHMRELCLYVMGDSILALATTEAALTAVTFGRWEPGAAELEASNDFHLLARSEELAENYATE